LFEKKNHASNIGFLFNLGRSRRQEVRDKKSLTVQASNYLLPQPSCFLPLTSTP
jgi:hypothetical protein